MFRSSEVSFLWRHLVFGFEMTGQVMVSGEAFPFNAAGTHVFWAEEANTKSVFLLLVSSQASLPAIAGVAVLCGTRVGFFGGILGELLCRENIGHSLRRLDARACIEGAMTGKVLRRARKQSWQKCWG
jgi:hypothetical protein